MFGLGMLIGVFLGGVVGLFMAALCKVGAQAEKDLEQHVQQMEEDKSCGNAQK